MTDEQDRVDASLVKRKLTKRERLRGAVQRGVSKVKKSDEESTRNGQFSLSDDVKDFLALRSPDSKPAAVPSTNLQSQDHDAKPATAPASKADTHELPHTTDPSDVLPHFPTLSRDPLPVPRINVATSPRFPHARELVEEKDNADMVSDLRIQDDSRSPPKRKARRKWLAVRFSDNPPTIIGEGGDDAEAPTMYLSHTRSRSTSDAPIPEAPPQLEQIPASTITRKPVTSPPQHTSPQHISPQSLQSMEFDMTLMPGLGDKSMPIQPNPVQSLQPTAARARLRMRAEEGKTLRESFHEASFDSAVD
jgi:hypothetical protein